MEQYGGVQLNPVGKNFNDTYQTIQIGLENSTLSGAQAAYNAQGIGFDNSQNTQNITRYNAQELTSNSTSKPVSPEDMLKQIDLLGKANKAYFFNL